MAQASQFRFLGPIDAARPPWRRAPADVYRGGRQLKGREETPMRAEWSADRFGSKTHIHCTFVCPT
jgi:hypothetical protein